MDNIKQVIELDTKLNNSQKKIKGSKWVEFWLNILLMVALGVVSYFMIQALGYVGANYAKRELLSCLIFVILIILIFYSVTIQYKTVLGFKDKILLSFLPIPKWQIYIGKIFFTFTKTILFSILLGVPIFVAYGIMFNMPFIYYIMSIITIFVLPTLAFGLAGFFAIPFMFVNNWLKTKSVLNLLVSVLVTVVAFYFYNELVFNVARLILLEDPTQGNIAMAIIEKFESKIFPSTWFAHYMYSVDTSLNLLVCIGVSIWVLILSVVIGSLCFKAIFNKSLQTKSYAKTIKVKGNSRKPFKAYFINEFKSMFRNADYAFTYFGMAIAMPVMVFFCNKFIIEFAVDNLGKSMILGTTLLVVLVFVSIICSPTASFISREGDNFWLLKTNPNGITIPLLAKSLIGCIVSIGALFLSLVITVIVGYLSVWYGLFVFGIASIFIIGLVAMGLLINLCRPSIFFSNIEHNFNMILHLFIGFIIAVGMGILSIVLSYKIQLWAVSLIDLGIVLIFSTILVVILGTQYKKLYLKVEV